MSVEAGQLNRILGIYLLGNSLARDELSDEEALPLVLEELRRVLDAHTVAAGFFEVDNQFVSTGAAGRDAHLIQGRRWSATTHPIDRVGQQQRGVLERVTPGALRQNPDYSLTLAPDGNAIYAPIGRGKETSGIVWAVRPPGDQFFSSDLDLLEHGGRVLSQLLDPVDQSSLLHEQTQRLQHLFDASFDPVLVSDEEGLIIDANQQALDLLASDAGDLVGRSISDLHVDETELPDMADLAVGGQLTFQSLVSGRAQEGSRGQVISLMEVRVSRLTSGQETVCQWIYHDLSSKIELEQMRQDLVAMLVHDLQSPLGNVISSLDLIKMALQRTRQDPDLLSLLDVASRSSNQLLRLIQSLLDISRLEAGLSLGEKSSVHLQKLVEDAYEIERPNFERRGVQLLSLVENELPPLNVEPNVIARVLLNLLDNALKYSKDGHTITVSAREAESGMVQVSVSDQGVGIPEAYRQTIFEKYERVKTESSSKGLGLGLAFCRLAVEAHGGRIWVDDAPRGGARFNFTVPKSPPSGSTNPVLVDS